MTTDRPADSETRTFHASQSDVAEIDRWMEDVGAQWGAPERAVFHARVCVAELTANALEHGGGSAERDTITVTLQRRGPDLRIEYADTMAPFDPTVIPTPSDPLAEDAALSGRGLRLLHAYALHLSYRHDGMRNVVSFRVAAKRPFPESRASAAFSS